MSWAIPRRVLAATAVLVLLSGCGTATTDEGASTSAGSPPGGTTSTGPDSSGGATTTDAGGEVPQDSFTDPPAEETGQTEDPQAPPADSVSLDLAGLPVGGFAEPVSGSERCVFVNWSGPPDIPAGVQVRATAVGLHPAASFVVAGEACPGAPPCLGGDHVMDPAVQCVVGVRQVAPTTDGFGSLSLTTGVVTCAPETREACEQFVAAVAALGPDSVEWFDAQVETGEDPDATTADEPEPTGGEPTGGDGDSSSQTG